MINELYSATNKVKWQLNFIPNTDFFLITRQQEHERFSMMGNVDNSIIVFQIN